MVPRSVCAVYKAARCATVKRMHFAWFSVLVVPLFADRANGVLQCTYTDSECTDIVSCEMAFDNDDIVFEPNSCISFFDAERAYVEESDADNIDFYSPDKQMQRYTRCEQTAVDAFVRGFCGSDAKNAANESLAAAQKAYENSGCGARRVRKNSNCTVLQQKLEAAQTVAVQSLEFSSCSSLESHYNNDPTVVSPLLCDVANHPAVRFAINGHFLTDVPPCFSVKIDNDSENRTCEQTSDGFPPLMCATPYVKCNDADASLTTCSATTQRCGMCQGRCIADNECADGLHCRIRPSGGTVPGCSVNTTPEMLIGTDNVGFCTNVPPTPSTSTSATLPAWAIVLIITGIGITCAVIAYVVTHRAPIKADSTLIQLNGIVY